MLLSIIIIDSQQLMPLIVIDYEGHLWVRGFNSQNMLDLDESNGNVPHLQRTNSDVSFVFVSFNHGNMSAIDTSGNIWVCGDNKFGQLGKGEDIEYTSNLLKVEHDNSFISISVGFMFNAALDSLGKIWVFGCNDFGQLGLKNRLNQHIPAQIENPNTFVQVLCGEQHLIAIDSNGNVWSCGRNNVGQLGLSDYDDRIVLTNCSESMIVPVFFISGSCGVQHTMLLDDEGFLWGCGDNRDRQLGLSDCGFQNVLTKIANKTFKSVSCGDRNTFALDFNGKLWSCGENDRGQLGTGKTVYNDTLTQVKVKDDPYFTTIACSYVRTYAKDEHDCVWSTGYPQYPGIEGSNVFEPFVSNINQLMNHKFQNNKIKSAKSCK